MMQSALSLVGGAAIICWAAEVLVQGGARLALAFRVPSMIVGLTVIAYGTSAPEAVVSTVSVLRGAGDLAVGNVLGSNVANLALILGAAALVRPLLLEPRMARSDLPLLAAVTLGFALMSLDGQLARWEGAILLGGSFLYSGWCVARAVRAARTTPAEEEHHRTHKLADAGRVAVGLGGLALGANLLVSGAVHIARSIGIGELVIGATVVAVGTSLPELAASVAAARRGEHGLSIGNVVGSNLFNLLMVLGLAACVAPISVPREALFWDMLPGLALTLVVLLLTATTGRIARWQGALLVAAFGAYATVCVLRQTLGWV